MKLKTNYEEVKSIGELDTIQSKIRTEDMGIAMSMVSKNLYSNPIGSFIREIVSNGVDANKEGETDNPVQVNIFSEGDTYYLEVIDEGEGMAPDKFNNVYMSWFNSDKRDSNEKRGGWGLGSKSPLSYVKSFEISTRVDGTEWNYIFADAEPLPQAYSINEIKTDNPNGTTIRIEIQEKDLYKVYIECENQLAYFRNVYVRHEKYFYDNEFKVYESDLYVLRSKPQPFSTMHICLGDVPYPINYAILDISPVHIPVGLKFNIGDLGVTLSREQIDYTEDTITLLKERIERVTEILHAKYDEQLEITDLFEYVRLLNDTHFPPLKIEDVSIPMDNYKGKISFKPFEGVYIKKKYKDYIFSAYSLSVLRGGKVLDSNDGSIVQAFMNRHASNYLLKDRTNKFDSLYIENGNLIKRKKIDKKVVLKIGYILDLLDDSHEAYVNINRMTPQFKPGALLKIHKFIKYVDTYLQNVLLPYEGVAPKEWIARYKEREQEEREERKLYITHYNLNNNQIKEKYTDLRDNHAAVYYIDKKDYKEKIAHYHHLFKLFPLYFRKKLKLIIVNPSVIAKLKNKSKFYPAKNIFRVSKLQSTFYKLKVAGKVEELNKYKDVYKFSRYYFNMYHIVKKKYGNNELTLYQGYLPCNKKNEDINLTTNILEYFKEQLDNARLLDGRESMLYEDYIPILKEVGEKLEIMNYMEFYTPHKFIYQVLRPLKMLKLNPKYYKENP